MDLEHKTVLTIGESDLDWVALEPEDAITLARFAKWVFRYEDGDERIKR